jgi:hypothetical protein
MAEDRQPPSVAEVLRARQRKLRLTNAEAALEFKASVRTYEGCLSCKDIKEGWRPKILKHYPGVH